MVVRPRALAFAFALLTAASRCAWADVLPGEWDIATTVAVVGQPGSVGPVHQTQCLGAAQADSPAATFGSLASLGAGCALSDKRDDGSSLSFHVTCSGPIATDGSGAVTYGPDHMEGDLQMQNTIAGQQVTTQSHVAARRIGPCQ